MSDIQILKLSNDIIPSLEYIEELHCQIKTMINSPSSTELNSDTIDNLNKIVDLINEHDASEHYNKIYEMNKLSRDCLLARLNKYNENDHKHVIYSPDVIINLIKLFSFCANEQRLIINQIFRNVMTSNNYVEYIDDNIQHMNKDSDFLKLLHDLFNDDMYDIIFNMFLCYFHKRSENMTNYEKSFYFMKLKELCSDQKCHYFDIVKCLFDVSCIGLMKDQIEQMTLNPIMFRIKNVQINLAIEEIFLSLLLR